MSKKLTRKLVALAMAAAMVSGTGFIAATTDNPVFPTLTVSAAATDVTDVKYFSTSGTTIGEYMGSDTKIVIPAKQNGQYFTTLGDGGNNVIPEERENGDEVKVTTVSFETGSKITTINSYAFYYAASLKKITLPDGLTTIDDYAFSGCTNLETIEIPASVTSIGECAFLGCTSLKKVVIKGTDKATLSIGKAAFAGCTALQSINFTDRISSIGDDAFGVYYDIDGQELYCTSLKSVNIPGTIGTINSSMFNGCSNLTSVTINEGIKQINAYAFQNCTGLEEIRLPKTVTSVGYDTFSGCENLKRLVVNGEETSLYFNYKTLEGIGVPSTTIIYSLEGSGANYYATKDNLTFYPLLTNNSTQASPTVEVGQKLTINKKATGGKGTYKYAVLVRKDGGSWKTVQNWTTDKTPYYYTIPEKGTYEVCVKVADMVNPTVAENLIEKKYYTVKGVVANTPLTLNAKLSSDVTVTKQPLTLTMSADGGSNNGYKYTVQYKKATDETWSTIAKDTTQTTVKITPQRAAEYTVRVIAKDIPKDSKTNPLQKTKYLTFTSYAQLTNLSTVSVSGKTVTVTKKAASKGGKLTYQVWYQKDSDLDKVGNWQSAGAKFTLPEAGTYSICVKVIDESKTVAKRYFSVTVK